MRNDGKSYREIQRILSCSAPKIFNAINYKQKPEKRGAKRKTTPQDDRNIVLLSKKDPSKTAVQIKSETELPVSAMTVRRRLLEAGLSARSPRKKPLLSKKNIWQNGLRSQKSMLIGQLPNGEMFCGLTSPKLFCLVDLVLGSMSGVPLTPNSCPGIPQKP